MEKRLLSQQELAERWGVTVRSIEGWRKDGLLTPCKGIPSIRFAIEHISELEGVKLDKLSPLERRRLERENEDLKLENEKMKGIIARITAEATQIYSGEVS